MASPPAITCCPRSFEAAPRRASQPLGREAETSVSETALPSHCHLHPQPRWQTPLPGPIAHVPIFLSAPRDCSGTNTFVEIPCSQNSHGSPLDPTRTTVLRWASRSCHGDITASRASPGPCHPLTLPLTRSTASSLVLYAFTRAFPPPQMPSPHRASASFLSSSYSVITPAPQVPGTSHVPLSVVSTC